MNRKKGRTLEVYKLAGAYSRLFKTVMVKFIVEIQNVLPLQDVDRLYRSLYKANKYISQAEENMYSDFPNLESGYKHVFYGNTSYPIRDSIDMEMNEMIKEIVTKIVPQIESEGTIQNRIVTDILNGIADWCCSEAPIDGEEESETFKVLKQVYEFVETFLDEGTPTETSTGKELE